MLYRVTMNRRCFQQYLQRSEVFRLNLFVFIFCFYRFHILGEPYQDIEKNERKKWKDQKERESDESVWNERGKVKSVFGQKGKGKGSAEAAGN